MAWKGDNFSTGVEWSHEISSNLNPHFFSGESPFCSVLDHEGPGIIQDFPQSLATLLRTVLWRKVTTVSSCSFCCGLQEGAAEPHHNHALSMTLMILEHLPLIPSALVVAYSNRNFSPLPKSPQFPEPYKAGNSKNHSVKTIKCWAISGPGSEHSKDQL